MFDTGFTVHKFLVLSIKRVKVANYKLETFIWVTKWFNISFITVHIYLSETNHRKRIRRIFFTVGRFFFIFMAIIWVLIFFRNDLMPSYNLTHVITLFVFENIFSHNFQQKKKHNNFFKLFNVFRWNGSINCIALSLI